MRVLLLDYEAGNLRSVYNALYALNTPIEIVEHPTQLRHASILIFPGVGEAQSAMAALQARKLDSAIARFARRGGFILGICVGAQLLLRYSEEHNTDGLGLIDGISRLFPNKNEEGTRLKVPHIGWNEVRHRVDSALFHGIAQDSAFYFVHSYYPDPRYHQQQLAWTKYGCRFASAFAYRNLFGVQFHPEKSGKNGLRLLANFIRYARQQTTSKNTPC